MREYNSLRHIWNGNDPRESRLDDLLDRGSVTLVPPYQGRKFTSENQYVCSWCGERLRKDSLTAPNFNYCYICGHDM